MACLLLLWVFSGLCLSVSAKQPAWHRSDGAMTDHLDKLENLVLKQDHVIHQLTVRLEKFERLGDKLQKENKQLRKELKSVKSLLVSATGGNKAETLTLKQSQHGEDAVFEGISNSNIAAGSPNKAFDYNSGLTPPRRVASRTYTLASHLVSSVRKGPRTDVGRQGGRRRPEHLSRTGSGVFPGVPSPASSNDAETVHHVAARADDPSPLEPVVAQLSQQVAAMGAEFQALKNADRAIQDSVGSTYVHWGTSACGGSSQLVYSGVVGGSYYRHSGAAANYLCLSMSPVFAAPHHDPGNSVADLYGAEYRTTDSHDLKDPVCAVCRSPRSTTIMVPGTNVCLAGWTTEYSGFLMAGEYDHAAASEYVCVDPLFDSRPGGEANNEGKLFYYTRAVCGSLPCNPYVNSQLITCAVCSK